MSMYAEYKTDSRLETQDGIDFIRDSFKVTLLRAGGSNKKFKKVMARKTKPIERAMARNRVEDEVIEGLTAEGFAEAVIIDWQSKVDGEWVRGIESPEGELLPFTKENVVKVLNDLPDLFQDIAQMATESQLFLESIREDEAKNS